MFRLKKGQTSRRPYNAEKVMQFETEQQGPNGKTKFLWQLFKSFLRDWEKEKTNTRKLNICSEPK